MSVHVEVILDHKKKEEAYIVYIVICLTSVWTSFLPVLGGGGGVIILLAGYLPGAGLMNTVINYASRKPSNPLHSYSYVHDLNLRQPGQITATMHKMMLVTTVIV